MAQNRELREDGGFELREDGSIELREGEADVDRPRLRRLGPLALPRRDAHAPGTELEIVAELFPGAAHGSGRAVGATIEEATPHHGHAAGTVLDLAIGLAPGNSRGQVAYDPAVIDADLLAIAGSF